MRNKKLFVLFYEFCCLYLTTILHFAATFTAIFKKSVQRSEQITAKSVQRSEQIMVKSVQRSEQITAKSVQRSEQITVKSVQRSEQILEKSVQSAEQMETKKANITWGLTLVMFAFGAFYSFILTQIGH